MTRLLEGKTALIFGVANDHSIAWGIAKAMHEHGARMAFSYAVESLERRVRPVGRVRRLRRSSSRATLRATSRSRPSSSAPPPISAWSTSWCTPWPSPAGTS